MIIYDINNNVQDVPCIIYLIAEDKVHYKTSNHKLLSTCYSTDYHKHFKIRFDLYWDLYIDIDLVNDISVNQYIDIICNGYITQYYISSSYVESVNERINVFKQLQRQKKLKFIEEL